MAEAAQALLAQVSSQTSLADLTPYLVVLGAGFLVGAWGNSAKSPLVTLAGLLLVLAAVIGFIVEFPVCPDGTECF